MTGRHVSGLISALFLLAAAAATHASGAEAAAPQNGVQTELAAADAFLPVSARPEDFLKTAGIAAKSEIPLGVDSFCERHPAYCRHASASRVALDDAKYRELQQVHTSVNRKYPNDYDSNIFGIDDHWEFASVVGKGDCEDLALEKKKQLIKRGWPASALLLAYVEFQDGRPRPGHAVLVARTDKGDYALDTFRASPTIWHQTPYNWVSMQAPDGSGEWLRIKPFRRPPEAARPVNVQVFPDG